MHWFYSCHPRHRWIFIIPNGVKSNETKLYSRIQYTSIAKCVKVYESYNMTHIIWVEWIPWDFLIFDTEHIAKIWLVCDVWNVPRIILQKKFWKKKYGFHQKSHFIRNMPNSNIPSPPSFNSTSFKPYEKLTGLNRQKLWPVMWQKRSYLELNWSLKMDGHGPLTMF